MSTTKWFLMVDGGSGLRITSVYGTPFPTGTADQDNSYLREAAISICVGSGAVIATLLSMQEIWPRQ